MDANLALRGAGVLLQARDDVVCFPLLKEAGCLRGVGKKPVQCGAYEDCYNTLEDDLERVSITLRHAVYVFNALQIHLHPARPPMPSIFSIANARRPLKALAADAALKKTASLVCISNRQYQVVSR